MTNQERIKLTFINVKAPEDFTARVLNTEKKAPVKRFRVQKAVLIAAVLCLLTTFVIVTANHLGGFDRLAGIIGMDRADELHPVERSNEIGSLITDEGIRIEVVAVGIDSNTIDFYFTLEDMIANRFEGDIWIYALIFPNTNDINQSRGYEIFPEVIHRSEDGIVTLMGREVFEQPITDVELRFNLYHIAYDVRRGVYEISFDLTSLEESEPGAIIDGTPVLQPNLHNIELEIEGLNKKLFTQISSIGIIDDRLHVQQRLDANKWSPPDGVLFHVLDPFGEYVPFFIDQWSLHVPVFSTDENGDIIGRDTLEADTQIENLIYHEYIYEIDKKRLSEYKIIAEYEFGEHIELRLWYTVFEISAP